MKSGFGKYTLPEKLPYLEEDQIQDGVKSNQKNNCKCRDHNKQTQQHVNAKITNQFHSFI